MDKHTQGFSLIELLITLTITAILTTLGSVSYHHLLIKSYRQDAENSLAHAAKLYRLYELQGSPSSDNTFKKLFILNKQYDFHIKQATKNNPITFIATLKTRYQNKIHTCTKLLLSLDGSTSAADRDGSINQHCW